MSYFYRLIFFEGISGKRAMFFGQIDPQKCKNVEGVNVFRFSGKMVGILGMGAP